MKLINLAVVIISILSFYSCESKVSSIQNGNIDTLKLANKFGDKPLLFISCLRCECFNEELNKIYNRNPKVFKKFIVYADTACSKQFNFGSIINHSSQLFLDTVYDENYNVVLFKKVEEKVIWKTINANESEKTETIFTEF